MDSDAGCKVDRVIETYGLEDADPRHESIGDGLLARWRGEDGHSTVGYRPLTDWFNRRLLRSVSLSHGRAIDGGRVEHDYDALTGDDDLRREEVVESLRADGIDATAVYEAMVSWGTMRTHLTECLDGHKEREPAGDWERDTIQMARSFAQEKVESALSSLETKGELRGVDRATVTVQVQIECTECPTRTPLDVALDRGYVCAKHAGSES
ncbi:MAG: rod-determining factor RdfA [Halapricum sp.]